MSWKFIEHIADTSLDDLPKDYEKKTFVLGKTAKFEVFLRKVLPSMDTVKALAKLLVNIKYNRLFWCFTFSRFCWVVFFRTAMKVSFWQEVFRTSVSG